MSSDDYRSFTEEEHALQWERITIAAARRHEQWLRYIKDYDRQRDNRLRKDRSGRHDIWGEHLRRYPLPDGYRVVSATDLPHVVRQRQTAALQKANDRRSAMREEQEKARKPEPIAPPQAQPQRKTIDLPPLPALPPGSPTSLEEYRARPRSNEPTALIRPGRFRNDTYDNRSAFYGDGSDHIDDMDIGIESHV